MRGQDYQHTGSRAAGADLSHPPQVLQGKVKVIRLIGGTRAVGDVRAADQVAALIYLFALREPMRKVLNYQKQGASSLNVTRNMINNSMLVTNKHQISDR